AIESFFPYTFRSGFSETMKAILHACIGLILIIATSGTLVADDDVIEFLTGTKVQGKVTKIDKDAKQVAFEAMIGGSKINRVYTYSKIHAVTYQGKRYVINEMTSP